MNDKMYLGNDPIPATQCRSTSRDYSCQVIEGSVAEEALVVRGTHASTAIFTISERYSPTTAFAGRAMCRKMLYSVPQSEFFNGHDYLVLICTPGTSLLQLISIICFLQRYKICKSHASLRSIFLDGSLQRFCQQVGILYLMHIVCRLPCFLLVSHNTRASAIYICSVVDFKVFKILMEPRRHVVIG